MRLHKFIISADQFVAGNQSASEFTSEDNAPASAGPGAAAAVMRNHQTVGAGDSDAGYNIYRTGTVLSAPNKFTFSGVLSAIPEAPGKPIAIDILMVSNAST